MGGDAAALARQVFVLVLSLRAHRLHHHHHALGRRRHGPHGEPWFEWVDHPIGVTLLLVAFCRRLVKGSARQSGCGVHRDRDLDLRGRESRCAFSSRYQKPLFANGPRAGGRTRTRMMLAVADAFPSSPGTVRIRDGVAVMPLVRGDERTTGGARRAHPQHKKLRLRPPVMRSSSSAADWCPPAQPARGVGEGRRSQGRALAYLAPVPGEGFARSTTSRRSCMWFAGASDMPAAPLVPRYLPPYGRLEWAARRGRWCWLHDLAFAVK